VTRLDCYPWLIVGTVCIGAFMGQVDASIAQLVLPELEREFHASIGAVAWVSIAYLLVVAAMLPVFGRLADMVGRKLLYCGGFVVFVMGSGLCGLAPSLETLVGARVLQALGRVCCKRIASPSSSPRPPRRDAGAHSAYNPPHRPWV
jgi:MFS family permease